MDYTELTPDDQWQIVQQRRRQLEDGHFRATLDAAEAQAAGNTAAETQASKQIESYTTALAAYDSAVVSVGVTEPVAAEPAAEPPAPIAEA